MLGLADQIGGDDLGIGGAIGDDQNDRRMLERAGFGVAMANAKPEVRAIANFVTESNADDGAAHAIERFVLGR